MFSLSYQVKLKIFSKFRNILKKFNLHLFYYQYKNYLKDFDVDNIIDVGVANGTNFLFKSFPNAKYFFVEPNPVFFEFIENKILKRYNSKLFKLAAGNQVGKKKMWSSSGRSSFLQRSDYQIKDEIEVNIDKLDSILKSEILKGKNLLKVDTEGYELEVLKGAKETLKKVDYLIIELRVENIKTYNPSEIFYFLYEKNFIFYKIMKLRYTRNGISVMDIIFVKV